MNFIDFIQLFEIILFMEIGYLKCYRHRKLHHQKLHHKILNLFRDSGESVDKMRNYDEILYVFDQRSKSGKASRGVCDELFNQTKNREGRTSISKMVWTYIQNLETAKLCLLRDQSKISQLKSKHIDSSNRQSTYVHLKIIQISVYSRFSKDAILSYEIQPSNMPPVTLQNAINPVLDHDFTFRLDDADSFSINLMDSGINIGSWTFPDQTNLPEGEYHRLITSQNFTFQVRIKYNPRNSNREKVELSSQLRQIENQKNISWTAFQNLVTFEPFLSHQNQQKASRIQPVIDQEPEEQQEYQGCMSFLGSHVRNLYVLLISLILAKCLLSYYSAVEFLDIMLAFYVIGLLCKKEIEQYEEYKTVFLAIIIGFIILTIKGFWGMVSPPFYNKEGIRVFMCVICSIIEILVIIALVISVNNLQDTAVQRNKFFYDEGYKPTPIPRFEPQAVRTQHDEESIYQEMTDRR